MVQVILRAQQVLALPAESARALLWAQQALALPAESARALLWAQQALALPAESARALFPALSLALGQTVLHQQVQRTKVLRNLQVSSLGLLNSPFLCNQRLLTCIVMKFRQTLLCLNAGSS